ncbi:ABC transporter ATP-binding protein [Bradyrhizobium sp. TM239]|uniref:ABC transporter ATP-binding protein n=1 Tax=Bradyrhizobium sp. TM239 TaxID=2599802 RepID=UPI0027D5E1A1|nr:ABC transporter ATP-binding protein [Bradyrhizobium sp. TM239]
MDSALTVRELEAGYGDGTVLHGIDLEVRSGTICCVLGRNGVGKSTLIQSIAGHHPVRQGKVGLNGIDATHLAAHKRAGLGMAVAPQGRRLFPSLTVREHLQISERGGEKPNAWNFDRVLKAFPRLGERLDNLGAALSGGEQSMVSMGRLLMANPLVALLDEPSEGLSPLLVQQVADVLQEGRSAGMAILLVEQNFGLVMRIADHVHIMNKGRIVYSGPPDALREDTETRHRYLGG